MTDTLVRMPKLADTLVEGTLGAWLKAPGSQVAAGEPLASIETDKVTTELTAPVGGTVLELLVEAGQTVAVDTPIARIGDVASASPTPAAREPSPSADASAAPPPQPPETGPRPRTRKPTPVAARLLAEHGLQPKEVRSQGRVTKADVLRHLEAKNAVMPLSAMRRAIAEHMVRAHQTIPRGQTVMHADLTELMAWRAAQKEQFALREGAPLTLTVLFVHALARAASPAACPRALHGTRDRIDLGLAVALDGGLIVPVIRGADSLSLPQIAQAVSDLATRARKATLKPDELQGAVMTLTNVGSFGNLLASPIVPEQQLGILGPGIVERRPVATPDGAIRVGWRCLLTLMFDRRELDDLAADRLLRRIVDELLALPSATGA
jgi:pyruvate/2-oxoglutarate dehydrogenase complex dihydrolipoamide acyltransferase (E2) component